MTPTVMGQKVEEILQICKKLARTSKLHQSDSDTANQDDQPQSDRGTRLESAIRDATYKRENQDARQKRWFWDSWSIQDRIQISLAVFTALAVASGVWSNIQTRSLVQTAQDTYNTANRAYIGPNGGTITTMINKTDNKPFGMEFKTVVKNFGNAPGEDFLFRWEPRLDGEPVHLESFGSKPYTLFPTADADLDGTIKGSAYSDIASGRKVLQMNIHISYQTNGKAYSYCERQQYDPIHVNFLNMGPQCDEPWRKGPIPGPS